MIGGVVFVAKVQSSWHNRNLVFVVPILSNMFFFLRFYLFLFRQRERERGAGGRGRKTSMCCCLLLPHTRKHGLQPRQCALLGIKPVSLWFAGWCSIHQATPAGANIFLFYQNMIRFDAKYLKILL